MALASLPDEHREVLLLVALEEMSYAEIAAAAAFPSAPSCRACRAGASGCV